MSQQYPGGLITKNPVVPSGPYQNSTASGVWTLDQAAQYKKADNWPTAGNVQLYIEDVFSTYLYTGNGSTQTITNGIDLSTKGGLVWMKGRSGATDHALYDTARGATKDLASNTSTAETTQATGLTAFSGTGFSIGALAKLNTNTATYASWTFRKQAKFFDIVTYTGNGVAGRTVSHNLGSVPGCMIVKRTDAAGAWHVYHTSLGGTKALFLNGTNAAITNIRYWNDTSPTSTVFTLGFDTDVNATGGTYIAYIFAHDAGGFGLNGTENVVSCGIYTGNGSANGPEITLGYEPQWVLIKSASSVREWVMADVMRGMSLTSNATLLANQSLSELTSASYALYPTATGFKVNASGADVNSSGATYIYIAIRRGPMKVPTSGTSVFNTIVRAGTAANATVSGVGFSPDLAVVKGKTSGDQVAWNDKLRGTLLELMSSNTNTEISTTDTIFNFTMDGASLGADATRFDYNATGHTYANWFFRRAPGFFDVVCWSATAASTQNHNLQVVPELAIFKYRTSTSNWWVYSAPVGLGAGRGMYLNGTDSSFSGNQNPITAISSTTFTTGLFFGGGGNWVTYLFATVAGVSKVGSYTGTGTTQVINCGFTAGSRFVMIKRTDSTGDWYVWDSARGIVAGNDPYLLLNSTAAEVTNTDYIDTAATGFEISSTAPAAINANGGTFIFLAIA